MDRSFLSQPSVVEASRRFICVRLATYENKAEAELLKSIFIGRSGELENTTFAILSSDEKRQLVRAGRSPDFAFRGPVNFAVEQMVSSMNRIADLYAKQSDASADELGLPLLQNFRLALNVASCDNQPLIVSFADDKTQLAGIQNALTPLAWSDEFIGQFLYASVSDLAELKPVEGLQLDAGLAVIQPGRHGVSGEVIAQVRANATAAELKDALNLAIVFHQKYAKQTGEQIQSAKRLGIEWKTQIPVTDPGPSGRGRPPGR
jgi:hypothetical protein